jgi:mannosyltransferase OCH1-like enzyme
MWNFKPLEKNNINNDVIDHNLKYINSYQIITPTILEEILNNNIFPELLELYNKIPHWVIKADLGRLLLIYFYSGIYSDVDCFINKNFKDNNIILFTEHICNSVNDLGPRECKNPDNVVRISNYFFGSKVKEHPFLKEVIEECLLRLKQLLNIENKTNLNYQDILWVCGPDVITTVYHRSKHNYNDITLYDNSYLSHKCYGSWR